MKEKKKTHEHHLQSEDLNGAVERKKDGANQIQSLINSHFKYVFSLSFALYTIQETHQPPQKETIISKLLKI